MARVTAIIPTYNRSQLVVQSVASVLAQTYHDLELIVVVDGSTDDTLDRLDALFGSKITVLSQPNQGLPATRNRGILHASGEFVAFLDDDDLWLARKLERQIAYADMHPTVSLIGCQAYWMNLRGRLLRSPPHGYDRQHEEIAWSELTLVNCVAGGGSAAVVRRACLDRTGLFDPALRFCEDWDLWLRLAREHTVVQLREPLVLYRINPQGFRAGAPRVADVDRLFAVHRAIHSKAFGAAGPVEPHEMARLEARSMAHIWLNEALARYGVGDVAAARTCWNRALDLDRSHASDPMVVRPQIVNTVAAYSLLDGADDVIGHARRILGAILDSPPDGMRWSRGERRALQATVFAELAHRAAADEHPGLARRCAAHCLWCDPHWFANIGLVKVLLTGGRHLLPIPAASVLSQERDDAAATV